MNFESPHIPSEEKEKGEGGMKNKLQKVVAFGAVGVAALAGEACSPDNKQTGDQQFAKEALSVLHNLRQENQKEQEKLLQSYFYNVGHPMSTVLSSKEGGSETKARAWDLVRKKGFFKNGEDGQIHMECKKIGLVPVEIRVNGQVVPVGPDDYSAEELAFIRNSGQSVEDFNDGGSQGDVENDTTPSSGKAFISHPDDF
ncbi:MAG: hypothetical protein NUV54_01105 [Candidatus Taylorbacteria bacterium]|nr:hypothetical protein [Candidatus Taylorbacteria bacterium]